MSHPPTTVRRRTRLLASFAAAGLVAGLGAFTAPTSAADPGDSADLAAPAPSARAMAQGSTTISASTVLKSTKRKKLQVAISASRGSNSRLIVSLNRKGEAHSWTFRIPKNALALNGKGKGKLVTKKIKPFGKLKLKITPTKTWKTTKCRGKVISKKRPLKVTGLFQFDSKSAWGKVGGKKVTFRGAHLVKHTGNDGSACSGDGDGGGGDGDDPCPPANASWSSFTEKGVAMSSQWRIGSSTTLLNASRTVKLTKPKGAARSDFRSAKVPVPTVAHSGALVTMQVRSSGVAKGTATLTGSTGTSFETTCEEVKSYEQGLWYAVAYQNGAKPLTMSMTAYGAIRLPNNTTTIIHTQGKAS